DGILCAGDQLIKINKKDVTHIPYDTVVEWIRSAKHVLHVQVTRWGFNIQASADTKSSTKRFSDPSVLNTFASVLFGKDNEMKNFLSPVNTKPLNVLSAIESGFQVSACLVMQFDDLRNVCPIHFHRLFLISSSAGSWYRRASFPNICYKREHIPTTVLQPLPNYSTTSVNLQGDIMNFDKISILINDEPEIEATIRPIKSGTETEISIAINNSCGLGIGCIGGCETALNVPVIHEIYPNGAAAKDGRLRPGDRISNVNRISLVGVPFLEAMNKLQMAYISKSSMIKLDSDDENENISLSNQEQCYLNLTIFRPTEQSQKWFDEELIIELLKKSGKGLGICIADRCVHLKLDEHLSENENTLKVQDNSCVNSSEMQTSYGVIVTEIIKGSIAANDGRLMANDQILEVNGKDTSTLTSEIVGALLKAAPYKVILKVGRLKNQIAIPNSAAFLFNDPCQVRR
ncbi:unnamed protein product, partial [Schistosoma margrebowiei]